MRHFADFGIVDNIKNSSTKQRLGAGVGLLGLAAAGGYAGYKKLTGEDDGGFSFKDVPQNLKGLGEYPLDKYKDYYGTPEENLGKGTDIYQNLKGTVEQVYRTRPNTPRDNIYDAIRYPDLRGQQFAETGERIKTVASNLGKGIAGGAKNTYNFLKDNAKPDFRENFKIRPDEFVSGKYRLDDLPSKDLLQIYKQSKGLEGSDSILDKAIYRQSKGF
jgi:hypothetical protein